MTGYGVCFEFSANNKEEADKVRGLIEIALKASYAELEIFDVMKPSLYTFETEYPERMFGYHETVKP
jgi:hypothetical protein